MLKLLIAMIVSVSTVQAFADQCQLVDKNDQKYVWTSANKLMVNADEFISYCEPCGGLNYRSPNGVPQGKILKVGDVKVVEGQTFGANDVPKYMGININGKDEDMAYVYVRTGSRVFTNLALMVGCPAQGVPPVLYTAPGKMASPVPWEQLASGARRPASIEKPAAKK